MTTQITINSDIIANNQPCYVISEIGAMYENIDGMKKLIKASKNAGAHAVKLQTFKAETLVSPEGMFEYEDGTTVSQYEFFKKYEISRENHIILNNYATELGVTLFSTPSDYEDVDFLDELGIPAFKTGSDDLTNYPFLEYIADKGKPIIVSTGMSLLGEIEEAINAIMNRGNDQIVLLHCTVSYPTAPQYANLKVIDTLQRTFGLPVGYSNHVPGILASTLAATHGACVVEVHVTLNRKHKRPDYQVSLEPDELTEMVNNIRLVPTLMGSEKKTITETEVIWRKNARKSLVAATEKKAGERIKHKDIKIMRPGTGLHPKLLNILSGRVLKQELRANQMITLDHF